MPDSTLEDKIFVVTGANGRMGRVLTPTYREAGARVIGVVRTDEKARVFQERTGVPDVIAADFTREKEVASCFARLAEQFPAIDGVIHTVGMWTETPLAETGLPEWEHVLSTNLTSAWLCFKHAVSVTRDGGSLIAFSSAQGADRGRARQAAYGAAKAGVVRLVEAAARELADRQITAHALAPSFIRYGEAKNQEGVDASAIASYCVHLCAQGGQAVNGQTIRLYGDAMG